jgi:hypothetical protein
MIADQAEQGKGERVFPLFAPAERGIKGGEFVRIRLIFNLRLCNNLFKNFSPTTNLYENCLSIDYRNSHL